MVRAVGEAKVGAIEVEGAVEGPSDCTGNVEVNATEGHADGDVVTVGGLVGWTDRSAVVEL